MADPARYTIDPMLTDGIASLYIERSIGGEWIKWPDFLDYKSSQKRNASLETNTSLGMEVAHLRAEVERLNQKVEAMHKAAVEDSTGLWLHPAFSK